MTRVAACGDEGLQLLMASPRDDTRDTQLAQLMCANFDLRCEGTVALRALRLLLVVMSGCGGAGYGAKIDAHGQPAAGAPHAGAFCSGRHTWYRYARAPHCTRPCPNCPVHGACRHALFGDDVLGARNLRMVELAK